MKSRPTSLRPPLLLALTFCAAASAGAATLHVPTSQYQTIQAGINAAQTGDIVLLADGTYTGRGNVNLDFKGMAITVSSQNGAAKTIIEGAATSGVDKADTGVTFQTAEGPASRLQGVSIENLGFGIVVGSGMTQGGPTISNCVIQGNTTTGMMASDSFTMTACLFSANSARQGDKAALTVINVNAQSVINVNGCTFLNNLSVSGGGGLSYIGVSGSSFTMTNCAFIGNESDSVQGGGGVFVFGVTGSPFTMTNCTFIGNQSPASTEGGGGANVRYPGAITNCVFTGNSAQAGGGLSAIGDVAIANCTFTGNTTTSQTVTAGAGLATSSQFVTNCLFYGDNGTEISGLLNGTQNPAVTYSDVQNGYPGTGNIALDPLFNNAPGDLHLRATSPVLGRGTSVGAPLTDKDGAVRPVPPSIGAYEAAPAILPDAADAYVLSSAPAQNFGSAPTLSVGGFLGAAYLQFDLTALKLLSATSTVKLRLNVSTTSVGTSPLTLSGTGTGWTETGLTFQTRPQTTQPLGFLNIVPGGTTATPYDVDVTAYVQAQQASGAGLAGFSLTQYKSGLTVTLDSKENAANDGPQLVVTY